MSKCISCGCEIASGMKFCGECGTPVPQTKKCPRCGAELPLAMKFCGECGYNFAGDSHARLPVFGDKNVIAGDVTTNIANTTIIQHDETKKVVQCEICGKQLQITDAILCSNCGRFVCREHFDIKENLCETCARESLESRKEQYAEKYADLLSRGSDADEYGVRTLSALREELRLEESVSQSLQREVRNARENARELVFTISSRCRDEFVAQDFSDEDSVLRMNIDEKRKFRYSDNYEFRESGIHIGPGAKLQIFEVKDENRTLVGDFDLAILCAQCAEGVSHKHIALSRNEIFDDSEGKSDFLKRTHVKLCKFEQLTFKDSGVCSAEETFQTKNAFNADLLGIDFCYCDLDRDRMVWIKRVSYDGHDLLALGSSDVLCGRSSEVQSLYKHSAIDEAGCEREYDVFDDAVCHKISFELYFHTVCDVASYGADSLEGCYEQIDAAIYNTIRFWDDNDFSSGAILCEGARLVVKDVLQRQVLIDEDLSSFLVAQQDVSSLDSDLEWKARGLVTLIVNRRMSVDGVSKAILQGVGAFKFDVSKIVIRADRLTGEGACIREINYAGDSVLSSCPILATDVNSKEDGLYAKYLDAQKQTCVSAVIYEKASEKMLDVIANGAILSKEEVVEFFSEGPDVDVRISIAPCWDCIRDKKAATLAIMEFSGKGLRDVQNAFSDGCKAFMTCKSSVGLPFVEQIRKLGVVCSVE